MRPPPLRWLLAGAGDIARKRVAAALQQVEGSRLDAVCSAHFERAAELAADFGASRAYPDYEQALADPAIDAVYIATPVGLHVPQAIRAMEAGKHVLVEKPLGPDAGSAAQAAAKARETGVIAGCAYYRRCYPSFLHARDVLSSGRIGTLIGMRTSYASWFNPAESDPKYWRVRKAQSGGGPLADMGSHMLDLMIALAGLPHSAYGIAATRTHAYEVEDSAAFLLGFRGGAVAQGSFHWNSRSWSHEFEILGTEGRLRWNAFDSGMVLQTIGRETEELRFPGDDNVHVPLVRDFVSAVTQRRAAVAPLEEAAKTNLVLDAVYASAAAGREVVL